MRAIDCLPTQQLTGVFEVAIYPESLRIKALRAAATQRSTFTVQSPRSVEGLDLEVLDRMLSVLNQREVTKRKRIYNQIYHEAMLMRDDRGISFTNMLLMLAQYKLIDVNSSLK